MQKPNVRLDQRPDPAVPSENRPDDSSPPRKTAPSKRRRRNHRKRSTAAKGSASGAKATANARRKASRPKRSDSALGRVRLQAKEALTKATQAVKQAQVTTVRVTSEVGNRTKRAAVRLARVVQTRAGQTADKLRHIELPLHLSRQKAEPKAKASAGKSKSVAAKTPSKRRPAKPRRTAGRSSGSARPGNAA